MLITRSLFRTLALALPLAVAAYPQAMVHYGAAVTAGSAAGAAAGKQASDALTKVMNGAAAAGQTANNSADVAAAEAQNMKKSKPEDAKAAREYKSIVKPANMASGGVGGGASSSPGTSPGAGKSSKKETELVASAASNVSPLSGKPLARTRRGTNVAPVEPVAVEPIEAPAYEIPASMQQELASFRPVLQPIGERLQRIAKGDSRDDLKRILGAPASKVTIPADRDVSEIYYYQEKGRIIATIRLEAGSVTRVNIDSL